MSLVLAFLPMIFKTMAGMDVTKDAEKAGLDGRPFWLSRRFLNSGMTALVTLGGAFGVSIPADQAAALLDAVNQIIDVFTQNAGLWAAIPTTVMAIWGTIRAGKSGKKKG